MPEAVAPLVHGPARVGRVLTRLSRAAVLVLDRAGCPDRGAGPGPVLALLAPGASGTPHGLRLLDRDAGAVLAAAEPGCRIAVGGGGLILPGVGLRAARVVPSRIPRAEADPRAVQRLGRLSANRPAGSHGPVGPVHPGGALTAVLSHDTEAGVLALLGQGPGLTPTGDDLLAGLLTGLWATGRAGAAARIGAVVRRLAPGRTTTLSADLVGWAARGHAGGELLAVVRAVQRRPAEDGALDRAAEALLRVGHTSGADLLAGLVVGLSGSHHSRVRRPPPDGLPAGRGKDSR